MLAVTRTSEIFDKEGPCERLMMRSAAALGIKTEGDAFQSAANSSPPMRAMASASRRVVVSLEPPALAVRRQACGHAGH